MTRYSELYQDKSAENDRLKDEFARRFKATLGDLELLRQFVIENGLQDQLAAWALKRSATTSVEGK